MTTKTRATISPGEGDVPLREILEKWNQGITVRRGDKWLFVNQAFADMCGYGSPEEVLSLGSTFATLPEHEHQRILRYQAARDAGEDVPTCYELQAVRKDASAWWAENRVQEIVWEGEPAYLTAVTDITARKEAEQALKDSERRFRDFAETASDWFWETDAEHRLTRVFGESEHHVAYWTEVRVGKTRFEERIADDTDDAKWEAHRADLKAHRPFKNFQFPARGADGAIHHVRISGTPNFSADGEFRGYRGMGSDITEFVEADERARSAQERLATAIDGLSESFALFDAEDRLVISNRTWRGFNLAIAEQSQPGARFEDILRAQIDVGLIPEARGQEETWLGQRLERHRNPKEPFEMAHRDGRWLLMNEHRLPDAGFITIATDITALKQTEHALKDSEQRFRDFAESASDWFWETDAEHRFTYVSEHNDPVVDGSNRTALDKTRFELRLSDDRHDEKWQAHRGDLDARRPFRNFDYPREGAKGEKRYIRVSGTPVFSESEAFVGYRGTASDITVQVNAEAALRGSESNLRDAQRIARLGGWSRDLHTGEVFWSEEMYQILGLDPEAVTPSFELYLSRLHPDDREKTTNERDRAIASGDGFAIESRVILPDGEQRFVRHTGETTFDGRGEAIRISGTVQDVTEAVRAGRELRDSEERFRAMFEQAAVGIGQVSVDGRFMKVNQKLCEITGYSPDELLDRKFQEITHADDLEAELRQGGQLIRGQIPKFDVEKRYLRKDGSTIWVKVTAAAVRDESAKVQYFISIIEDIDERKSAEQAARESEARAEQAHAHLVDAIESLQEGFAFLDSDGRLVMTNKRFLEFYAELAHLYVPGTTMEDITRGVAESGLVAEALGREDEWGRERLERFKNPGPPFERQLGPDLWLLTSERKTSDGGTVRSTRTSPS